MSGAVTTAVVSAVATAVVSSVLAPKPSNPGAPPQVIPPPAPQASKTPDQASIRRQGTNIGDGTGGAATAGTPAGTLLTGPGGVDTKDLKLGKNTALGS